MFITFQFCRDPWEFSAMKIQSLVGYRYRNICLSSETLFLSFKEELSVEGSPNLDAKFNFKFNFLFSHSHVFN
jgi:hypothetical protein